MHLHKQEIYFKKFDSISAIAIRIIRLLKNEQCYIIM